MGNAREPGAGSSHDARRMPEESSHLAGSFTLVFAADLVQDDEYEMIGTSLSHYRITAKLGQGGMGEVYRATDDNLGRDVAIKVLPEEVAGDDERLARFKREAHLLASLHHTNIASIYGLEEDDGKPFLVLELVEGEDLSERLKRGAIPVDEATSIATQIAEALEEAHEQGIVHRDLKPANVKLTEEGRVKVLDFGLAKAYSGEAPGGSAPNVSQSPTMSAQATQAGVILGTAAYMSPEQARGKPVDKRADIWAFGVVVYEMLTGRRLFDGETVSDILAAVLKEEPDWSSLPSGVPRRLRELLRRCLTRNPRQRLHDVADARIELEAFETATDEAREPALVVAPGKTRERIAWAIAAGAIVAAAWLAVGRPTAPPPRETPMRLRLSLEPSLGLAGGFDLSPDGTHVVFHGLVEGGGSSLFMRSLEAAAAVALLGTEGMRLPFFSPDGEWIGAYHWDNRSLMKMPRDGGMATSLADVNVDFRRSTASWGTDGRIRFTQLTANEPSAVYEIDAQGGEVIALRTTDPRMPFGPRRVPGTSHLLLTLTDDAGSFDTASLALQQVETGERRVLVEGALGGRLTPDGRLVFARAGAIVAVPLDTATLTPSGPERILADDAAAPIGADLGTPFAISEGGMLVYLRSGQVETGGIAWVDRDGVATPVDAPPRTYGDLRISPDGSRSLLHTERDVWSLDLARGALTRLSFEVGEDETALWSPDGRWIAWAGNRPGSARHVFRQRADGSGDAESLWSDDRHFHLACWSPDGASILITIDDPDTSWDILTLDVETGETRPLITTRFDEHSPRQSPDGRWMAYVSNETGSHEVYVQAFPGLGDKVQVSTAGGGQPIWARDGAELFFRSPTHLMAAKVSHHEGIEVSAAAELFEATVGTFDTDHTRYDVAADGRFLMPQRGSGLLATDLEVVVDAFAGVDGRR